MTWQIRSTGSADTERVGKFLGELIKAPEVIELHSDLGGGKTTFVKGLVQGLGSKDRVGSPTFTLSKVYNAGKLQIHHFDFYRLEEPGVVKSQLEESMQEPNVITVVEWSNLIKDTLPKERIGVEFRPVADNPDERIVTFKVPESKMQIIEKLRNKLAETEP